VNQQTHITDESAANCRAILAKLTVNGKVDQDAFLAEMDHRAASFGKPITTEEHAMLKKIVAAYEAEVADLADELRHADARLTLSADVDPDHTSLESKLRATQFRARIRNTIKELEITKCK
jgi:hypothetical protein